MILIIVKNKHFFNLSKSIQVKIIIINLIIFSFISQLYSQTIKKYSGQFEDGIATYEYYENEKLERVYHGSFTYNSKEYKLTGSFKNNKKNGKWSFIKTKAEYIKSLITPEFPIEEIATGSFLDGDMNGNWLYQFKEKATGKILKSSAVTFDRNKLIGKYKFSDLEAKKSIEFTLNKISLIDGNFIFKYKNYGVHFEDIRKYKNGIRYFQIHRNLQTGEILETLDISPSEIPFINDSIALNILRKYDKSICKLCAKYIDSQFDDSEYNGVTNIHFLDEISSFASSYVEFWYEPFSDNPVFSFKKGSNTVYTCFEQNLKSISIFASKVNTKDIDKIDFDSPELIAAKLAEEKEILEQVNEEKSRKIRDSIYLLKVEEKRKKVEIEIEIAKREELEKFFELKESFKMSLEEYNKKEYIGLKELFENFIKDEFTKSKIETVSISGDITIKVDSMFNKNIDVSNFKCSDQTIEKNIMIYLNSYQYPKLVTENYKCNYSIMLSFWTHGEKGKMSFDVHDSSVDFINKEASIKVERYFEELFREKEAGFYKISYIYLKNTTSNLSTYEIIKFKPD